MIYGLTNGAVVALNAVGFTLAYAAVRPSNLAHGNVFALTTVLVATLGRAVGVTAVDPPALRVGLVVPLAVCGAGFGAILNAAVERLAFRPFARAHDPLGPLMASMALSLVLLQAAVWWHAAYNVPRPGHQGVSLPLLGMPDLIPAVDLGWGGVSVTLKDVLVLLLACFVIAALAAVLARSQLGRALRAVAQDWELLALCGGDPRRAQMAAFAVAGALAGFGAAIFASYYGGTTAQHGVRSGLPAMTAAVLLVVAAWLGVARLADSRIGRAWVALRDDETAAQAAGVNQPRAKLLAFAIGAGLAGAAGALFASLYGHVEPRRFDLTLSLMVLAAVAIGRRWGLLGVVLGALVVALYDRVPVDLLTAVARALGMAVDLGDDNFAVFGIALYVASLPWGRSQTGRSRARASLLLPRMVWRRLQA